MATDAIICPHCGQPFDAADPRVQRLTPAAYHAWHTLRRTLKDGQTVGVTHMAAIVGVQPPSLYPHLRQMLAYKLAERIPKRQGGQYHVYRLAM